ncbi:MAG TPA: hypothetical protein VIV55_10195 [Flavobacterium sp.]
MTRAKKQADLLRQNKSDNIGQGAENIIPNPDVVAKITDTVRPMKRVNEVAKHPDVDPKFIPKDYDEKSKKYILNKKTNRYDERITLITEYGLHDRIADIAHWERLLIKDIVDEALKDVIAKYEIKNKGKIKPRPE